MYIQHETNLSLCYYCIIQENYTLVYEYVPSIDIINPLKSKLV
jgi:hypothetical protein